MSFSAPLVDRQLVIDNDVGQVDASIDLCLCFCSDLADPPDNDILGWRYASAGHAEGLPTISSMVIEN